MIEENDEIFESAKVRWLCELIFLNRSQHISTFPEEKKEKDKLKKVFRLVEK